MPGPRKPMRNRKPYNSRPDNGYFNVLHAVAFSLTLLLGHIARNWPQSARALLRIAAHFDQIAIQVVEID